MQDFKHFDPKQAAMDEARGLLEAAARAAMADGSLPDEMLRDLLDKSYALVLGGFSKKKQAELLG